MHTPRKLVYTPDVKSRISTYAGRAGGQAAACLMLFLWLGAFAITVCPALHQLLHADAQSPNHICLVTQLKQQPLLAGFDPIAAPAPVPVLVAFLPAAGPILAAQRDFRIAASRAPPLILVSSPVVGQRGA